MRVGRWAKSLHLTLTLSREGRSLTLSCAQALSQWERDQWRLKALPVASNRCVCFAGTCSVSRSPALARSSPAS